MAMNLLGTTFYPIFFGRNSLPLIKPLNQLFYLDFVHDDKLKQRRLKIEKIIERIKLK